MAAGRALSEGKEAPQAAFPSWCFPAQTKRRTEGIRVPVPLAWGGSSTARVLLRLCPESACQTGPSLELSSRLEAGGRSEEHTSELQSPTNLVCRLLLEKKKKIRTGQQQEKHKQSGHRTEQRIQAE